MSERTLYIIRGLPSSGKSTLARLIAPAWHTSYDAVTQAQFADWPSDDHTRAAVSRFASHMVGLWMRDGKTPIAIANVNATKNDVGEWAQLAASHGYHWSVIHVETDLSDYDLAQRSQTNCPADAIARFRARWEPWGA